MDLVLVVASVAIVIVLGFLLFYIFTTPPSQEEWNTYDGDEK